MTNLSTLIIVVSATITQAGVFIHQPAVDLDEAQAYRLRVRAAALGVTTHDLLERALAETSLAPYYLTEARLHAPDLTRKEILRNSGYCMNGEKHGFAVRGGRCQRCFDAKQKSERAQKLERPQRRAA